MWVESEDGISLSTVSGDITLKVVFFCFLSCAADKAKVSSCQVIVHCLAGISRSATIAIAYIMKTMGMSSDDAYR